MVNQKNYSKVLRCSHIVKGYIEKEVKEIMLEEKPELKGSNISNNQAILYILKNFFKSRGFEIV